MLHHTTRAGLALCALGLPLIAQDAASAAKVSLRYAVFDPSEGTPGIPPLLGAGESCNLWIVQFDGKPTETARASVAAAGGTLHGYLPDNAYVVRMPIGTAATVRTLPTVRWVDYYHPAYRLEEALLHEHVTSSQVPQRRYNIVVVDKWKDKPALIHKIGAVGGTVDHEQPGSLLLEATLTAVQLLQVAAFDEVLWIDRWTAAEFDMNNARIQGGGNYVATQGGYLGTGVKGHVYEGVEATHPDFTHGPAIAVLSCNSSASHGHCTAGIVFGNGNSTPNARGMAPDANIFFTNNGCINGGVSRWQVVQELVNNREVSHTTASWGGGRTRSYTSTSADTDDIIFDHDIAWTQSQSNAGNQDSRPEAWAKNIFSIGGVQHRNNANRNDDSWAAGGASTGPAADGRIKPTLCAYYDAILCSDLTGSAGYASGNSYSNFGGTSGATPIIAGHNILAIQMFTDGIFGNTLRVPGGTRHQNRPHFTTLKALQVASARQYTFTASSSDNRREHQGWGFPDLSRMYDNRTKTLIVDETDILTQDQYSIYTVNVAASEPDLKICMTYSDPAANPSATVTRINDIDLKVTSPSGTVYWGNNGLNSGVWSAAGGAPDSINPIECVFVQNPQAGAWEVQVIATLVVQDSHVETPVMDADYGLVVSGAPGTRTGGGTILRGSFHTFGTGCGGGTFGTASLAFAGDPTVNSSFTINLSSLEPNQFGVIVAGFNDQTWVGPNLPLPQSLASFGLQGCSLYINPDITDGLSTGSNFFGLQTYPVNVPNILPLIGSQTFFQYFFLDPTAGNTAQVGNTNAGRVILGT